MKRFTMTIPAGLLALAIIIAAGCGGGEKKGQAGDEAFKVPDSVLSTKDAFNLTVDEYHPIKGGKMVNDEIDMEYVSSPIAQVLAVRSFGEILEGFRHVNQDIARPASGSVVIIFADNLDEYRVVTRKEWWYYAWVKGDTIYSSPMDIMLKRFDPVTKRTMLKIGMTQRMAQMALDRVSNGRVPVWLKEAAASYVADERPTLRIQIEEFSNELADFSPTLEELENYISEANDRMMSRGSYFFAYRMLENLMEAAEFTDVVTFAKRLGEGVSLDDASREVFGKGYLELVAAVRPENLFAGAGPVPDWKKDLEQGHTHEH